MLPLAFRTARLKRMIWKIFLTQWLALKKFVITPLPCTGTRVMTSVAVKILCS